MAYENPLMTELMVPRDPDIARRIHGFFEHVGWNVRNASDSEFFTYVNPLVSKGQPPTIAYWQTENVGKQAEFIKNDYLTPSEYANGLRLPRLLELVEVCLIVPSDEDVHTIFERGGKLLEAHTHIPPRDHAGKQEFRFSDPFNYSLRVTNNPGWEIKNHAAQVFSVEEIANKDQFLALEHALAFRERYFREVSSAVARRAFGILVNPSVSFGKSIARRTWLNPAELGLIVLPREQAGIAPPEQKVKRTDVVQVGSFLDYATNSMSTSSLYGLNDHTRAFLAGLASKLERQIEQPDLFT